MDAYRVLQVAPDCADEVLHGAYRALALKYHPDRDTTRHDAARRRAAVPTFPTAASGTGGRWLSRHTSGIRYRTEIYAILGKMAMGAA